MYNLKEDLEESLLPRNGCTIDISLIFNDLLEFNIRPTVYCVLDSFRNTTIEDFDFIIKVFGNCVEEYLAQTKECRDLYVTLFEQEPPQNKEEAIEEIKKSFRNYSLENKDKIITITKENYNISFVKEE